MRVKLVKEISSKHIEWRNDSRINSWTRANVIMGNREFNNWLCLIDTDETKEFFGIVFEKQLGRVSSANPPHPGDNIGTCGLSCISPIHRSAEFSILIDPTLHGRGFGQAALKELIRYGFQRLDLRLIWGETFEGNKAIHMFQKLGFITEGTLRQRYYKNARYTNSIVFSLLKEEYGDQPWSKTSFK